MPAQSARAVMEALDDNALLGTVLGERKGGQPGNRNAAKNDADNISIVPKPRNYGTGRAYLLARLDRDGHTELAAKVRACEMSARAAAIKAGIHKLPLGSLEQILKLLPKLVSGREGLPAVAPSSWLGGGTPLRGRGVGREIEIYPFAPQF